MRPTAVLVAIGASQGGVKAVEAILDGLPADFSLPIAIVQHRSPRSTGAASYHGLLQEHCGMPVIEVGDKEPLMAGRVYVAPADYHLLVESGHLALSADAPVNFARPSIDVLFKSAAESYGKGVVAVVLTGANADGAEGAALVGRCGGIVVVQDPATAENPAMPAATMAAVSAARVLPLAEIAPFLMDAARGKP